MKKRRSAGSSQPKLLTLEMSYSLATTRARGMEHDITCRDLSGFFEHVWTVHPAVGARPEDWDGPTFDCRPLVHLSPRHTVIESPVGAFSWLAFLPRTNFALAQCTLILKLRRLVRGEGIRLIRACDPYYTGLIGLLLSRTCDVPLVVRVNANYDLLYQATGALAYPRLLPFRLVEQRIARLVLRRAALVAAGNANNREFALANGASPERAVITRCGLWVDPIHFQREPTERDSVRQELDLGDRPFVVLVSRLEAAKFPEDILSVVAKARARSPDLAAVFVGDGSLRQHLESSAATMGLSDDVRFVGDRPQEWVASALSSASVVLSPLTGRALVEGCLSGTPVVAYDIEWHSELIQSGETGVLVPYRDTVGMAEAVCDLLASPPRAARLAAKARAFTLDFMDPARLLDQECSHYARLLAKVG